MSFLRPPLIAAIVLCAAGFVAGLCLSVDKPQPESQIKPKQAFQRDDAAAYVEAGCWSCHTVTTLEEELRTEFGEHAAGARHAGPDLAGAGARYHRDWHVAHVWNPQDVFADSRMPAQRQLFRSGGDQPELNELGRGVVNFLTSLTTRSGINRPWPEEPAHAPVGDPATGHELYLHACAGCHGRDGRGDGPAAKFFVATRRPLDFRREALLRTYGLDQPGDAIYTSITNGVPGTGMPSFGSRLSDRQRADIAAYVATLGATE